MTELVEGEAEDGPVDDGHPVDRPVLGRLFDRPIELVEGGEDALGQAAGPRREVRVGIERPPIPLVRLVQGGDRLVAWLDHALVRYSPVRVSTRIRSPCSTKSGVWT